jgi:TRAP-type C4-dicarboxylate transport system permease small subunit
MAAATGPPSRDIQKPEQPRDEMSDVPSSGRLSLWRRFTEMYSRVLSVIVVASLVILIVPVSMQIFSRFTHIIPHYIWTEEMARCLFVWTIMLGSILGVREGSHLVVDVWPRMAPRPEAALRLLSSVAILIMALVFVWAGLEFTSFAWYRISELAEMPLWLIHVAWPVAGVSWLVFLGEQFYDDLRVLVGRNP